MEPVRLGATMLPDIDIGSGSLRFAMDYLPFDYHGDTYSNIDQQHRRAVPCRAGG